MRRINRILGFMKDVWEALMEDEVAIRAGSVAFYAALSLAPLVLLFVAVTELIGPSTQQQMIESVRSTVGPHAADMVENIAIQGRRRVEHASWSMIIGGVILLFSASGVLAALQAGLNHVWGVQAAPGKGLVRWFRKRLISMAMVLAMGFLLLVSLVLTSVIAMIFPMSNWGWQMLNAGVSLVAFVLLFASLFKVLPDARIAWRDVWFGAGITAIMFAVGKYVTGLYIAHADYSQSYGAAGSIVVILIWVFYGSMVLFVGAEVTQVRLRHQGRRLHPNEYSTLVDTNQE